MTFIIETVRSLTMGLGQEPKSFIDTDLVMINGFDEGEHELVPMLKLIDFGMARDRNEMDPDKKYVH